MGPRGANEGFIGGGGPIPGLMIGGALISGLPGGGPPCIGGCNMGGPCMATAGCEETLATRYLGSRLRISSYTNKDMYQHTEGGHIYLYPIPKLVLYDTLPTEL